ncbi:MAG: putative rane protein [Alphaproteobacteria bacterium]|nr:putative rane protein [Alphaproteobacteria bacterium]MDB5740532.1 putative rane protein [Alphaproteobacteria bacterium]
MPRITPALTFALFAGLAAFAVAAFSPGVLNDGDTYWHIRAGEWMLAHGAVLRTDPFSYTAAGAPWHTQEWLAEVLLALSWRGGWAGVHLMIATAAALTAGVVGYCVRRRVALVPALLATVLGLACATGSLLARPHILSLLLLAMWTTGLVTAREKNSAPSWWLIPLMLTWANLHGSFAFGLALAVALMVEAVVESPKRAKPAIGWSLFLAVAIASALLTPFGIAGLLFPFRLLAMTGLGNIGEWQASDFSHVSPFAIALLASLFVFGSGKIRIPMFRLLLLVGLAWLALNHGRHQMLLGVVAPLLLAPSLGRVWPAPGEPGKPLFAALALTGFSALIALRAALPVVRGNDPVSPATALAHVPLFVRATPVLNDYSFGGYLIWNGVKPFIDGRADLYGDIFLGNYDAITAPDKDALAATLAFYHVRWTIFGAGAPVVKLLDATPGWHRFYADKLAVVHVHD